MALSTQAFDGSSAGREEMSLADAHETLRLILGAIEEYVYMGEFLPDDSYRVLFAGPCREQFLGMTIEEARVAVWADYVHPSDMALFNEAHVDAHKTGRLDVEYRIVGADGCVRWVRDRGRLRNEGGRRLLDGSVLDVTAIKSVRVALEAARREAQHAAQIDPLTGVSNRRSLQPRLATLGDQPVGVLSVDIDHFKNINDLFGHAAGDAVLVAVATRLRETTRGSDAIFRMGGEEFLLILPGLRDDTALLDVAEAVRHRINTEPVLFLRERIEPDRVDRRRTQRFARHHARVVAAGGRSGALRSQTRRAQPRRACVAGRRFRRRDRQRLRDAAPSGGDGYRRHGSRRTRWRPFVRGLPSRRAHSAAPRSDRPHESCAVALAAFSMTSAKCKSPRAYDPEPGPLSDDEWKLMRRHSELGEILVAAVPDLRPVAPIVRHHHERYDGAGYPDGLVEKRSCSRPGSSPQQTHGAP